MKRALLLGLLACGGRTDLGSEGAVDGASTEDVGLGLDVANGKDGTSIQDGGVFVDVIPPPFDAGPPPPGIQCGTSTCNEGTEVCCVTFGNQTVTEACTAPSGCNGAALTCSSAQNCPSGEVCCASFSQVSAGSECQPACKGGFQNPQLCASSSECPAGETCKNSPFGFKTCRP